MQFIRGLHNLKIQEQSSIVTIGSFDGLHRGHQQILQQMLYQSLGCNLPSVMILFEPQPKEYFMRELAPPRLMPLREKLVALHEHCIDKVVCLSFNTHLERLSAEQFVETILVQKLHLRFLWVGKDFRFGYRQKGDVGLLQELGKRYGFQVLPAPLLESEGEPISSTRIRSLLQQGKMQEAQALLGHPLRLSGRVMRGDSRGRQIGFPTANVNLPGYRGPLAGVYAVRIGLGEQKDRKDFLYGVANMGKRPTFGGGRDVLEVHLFDFNADIYGQRMEVAFLGKLRDEQRFSGVEALKQQIAEDVEEAKRFLSVFIANEAN